MREAYLETTTRYVDDQWKFGSAESIGRAKGELDEERLHP